MTAGDDRGDTVIPWIGFVAGTGRVVRLAGAMRTPRDAVFLAGNFRGAAAGRASRVFHMRRPAYRLIRSTGGREASRGPCAPCGFGLGSDPFIAPRGIPHEMKVRCGRPPQYRDFSGPGRFSRRRPQAMPSAGTYTVENITSA